MARGFGTTIGVAATDRLASPNNSKPGITTISMWLYLEASVSVAPRLMSNTSWGELQRTSSTNLRLNRFFTTTTGRWYCTSLPQNEWFHFALTYDSASTANVPSMYVNGESVAVNTEVVPEGSPSGAVNTLVIGNNSAADKPADAGIAGFAIYNVILSAANIAELARGRAPALVVNASLLVDVPMTGSSTADSKNTDPTVTGTAVITDPTIYTTEVPILYTATSASITDTTATIGCSSDRTTGTLHWYVSTSATPPSIADLKAGTGAAAAQFGSVTPVVVGANTFSVVSLTAATPYYTYFVQDDGVEDSNVLAGSLTTASAAGVAAVLSAPGSSAVAGTTATVSVTTDKNTGTLYRYISTSGTPPSAADLKDGTGSVQFDNTTTITIGANSFNLTSLSHETQYFAHFIQNDADGDSNIVSTAGFTTEAAPVVPPAEGDIVVPSNLSPAGFKTWVDTVTARLNALDTVPTGASVVLATDDQAIADANPTRTFIVIT